MEVENLTYKGISSLDVMEMEAILKECPWFSFLRERLMEKLYSLDKEAFLQQRIEILPGRLQAPPV